MKKTLLSALVIASFSAPTFAIDHGDSLPSLYRAYFKEKDANPEKAAAINASIRRHIAKSIADRKAAKAAAARRAAIAKRGCCIEF